jgi:hypothetical protein
MLLERFTPLFLHDRSPFGFAESSRKRGEDAPHGGQAVRTSEVRQSDGLVPWRASQNEIVYHQVSHEVLLECDASSHRFFKHHEESARCLDPVNNAFVLQDVAGFAEVIANVRLLSDPADVTRDAVGEIDGGFVTGRPR